MKFAAVIASFLGRVQITSLTSPLLSDDETTYSCYAITDDGGGGDCATDVWRIIKSDGGRKARCVGETVIERGRKADHKFILILGSSANRMASSSKRYQC